MHFINRYTNCSLKSIHEINHLNSIKFEFENRLRPFFIFRESLTEWEGFCKREQLPAFELLIANPGLITIDAQNFSERLNDLSDYFNTTKLKAEVVQNNPIVLLDNWNSLKKKLDLIVFEMKVSPKTLAKSQVLGYDFMYIKDRYEFLLRAGLYQYPSLKSKALSAEAYPKISEIVETTLATFVREVAGHGFQVEDFELFVKSLNSEFDDREEALAYLENGFEVDDDE